jgi:hypothetical protein
MNTNQTPEQAARFNDAVTSILLIVLENSRMFSQKRQDVDAGLNCRTRITEIIQAQRAEAVAEATAWRGMDSLPGDDTLVELVFYDAGRWVLYNWGWTASSIKKQIPVSRYKYCRWRPAQPLPQHPQEGV